MDQDELTLLSNLQEAIQKLKEKAPGLDNKDLKIEGATLQQQLLSAYWCLKRYLETLDITGFPVKILDSHHVYVRDKNRGISKNLKDQFSTDVQSYSGRWQCTVPGKSLGVLLDVNGVCHLVGIYDQIGDQFITRYKLRLREQDYTTNLTPEERAKVENARKKLIMRKYKKDNFKIIDKLQETKA
jgi:hypothetical protein